MNLTEVFKNPIVQIALNAANTAIDRAANNPNNPLQPHEAPAVKAQVEASIVHAAANTPELQPKAAVASTGVWGSLFTILSSAAAIVALLDAGNYNLALWAPSLTAGAGGLASLWGRIRAVRPITKVL